MTAATRHTSPSAFLRQRFERILLVFVVCVPVPTLALSGLAIPLPGVVERVGAALVPWANVATLDTHKLAASATRGTIVLTPDQQAAAFGVETTEVAAKSAVRAAEAKASRPVASNMRSAEAATQMDTAEPTTPESAPTDPAVPQGGGDGPAAPAPAPAPTPSPGEPTVGTGKDHGGNGPADPTRPPTVDPAPEPESKDDADVKPVDEPDVKPPDEKGDGPPTPASEPSANSGSTPDLEPDVVATPTADGNGNGNGNGDGGVGNGNGHSNGNGATERGSAK